MVEASTLNLGCHWFKPIDDFITKTLKWYVLLPYLTLSIEKDRKWTNNVWKATSNHPV